MDKVTQFFAILGAFSALCGLIAKALPPGKAQAAFAWLGTLSAPKALPAAEKAPEEPRP